MARQHLLDQCRAGARKSQDEDRLRGIAPRRGARQQLDIGAHEKPSQTLEERLDRLSLVSDTARLLREFRLARHPIAPRVGEMSHAIVQSTALEQRIAVELRQRLKHLERLRVVAATREIVDLQQIDVASGRGAIQQLLGALQIALHFVQLRPVRKRLHVARIELIGARKKGLRFGGAALFHQVDPEVRQTLRLRRAELQSAAEMPLAGRQVVQFAQHYPEQGMGSRVARIRTQRGAGGLFRAGQVAAREGFAPALH